MIGALESVLGQYVQLNGEGIASLNWEWLWCGVLLLLSVWFCFKVVLRFLDWLLKR